jgi:hypothetical protein
MNIGATILLKTITLLGNISGFHVVNAPLPGKNNMVLIPKTKGDLIISIKANLQISSGYLN